MPASSKSLLFVSSVQKELAAERRALKEYVHNDPLLSRFFEVFLFEDTPASDRRADQVYLPEVDRCAIYCGLFGNDYGFENIAGISPTELEFDRASAAGKTRLIFVKGADDKARHPKMRALIGKAGGQLIRRRFENIPELTAALYASLVEFLDARGTIQSRPFEDRPAPGATLDDIDAEAVATFVRRARTERQFSLRDDAPLAAVLEHLNLLCDRQPTQAALLLFGRQPQRFTPAAEVRCMHFHGTEVQRPVPYYQIFQGSLFEQVDRATNFALGVLNRGVGTRALSNQAPVLFEIPPDVIREAIVNAIAHRDYTSAAAVQVSVFADRVEIWNPGMLPPPLTPERLREPHRSIAHNPRIAEALFLARYIEKYGTGTLMMIRESAAHSLPEPDFEQRGGEFVTTVWRDWLTASVLDKLGLSERQVQAVAHIKRHGRITNADYQQLVRTTRKTATRDLDVLVVKGVFQRVGEKRGSHYVLSRKK
jgi:ATP-dependent DNA helicase RecG